MARQSITLTEPNNNWLKQQVESKEYSSKSELVNNLIRQARNEENQVNWIRAKLNEAEQTGFTEDRFEEIINESKKRLRATGVL